MRPVRKYGCITNFSKGLSLNFMFINEHHIISVWPPDVCLSPCLEKNKIYCSKITTIYKLKWVKKHEKCLDNPSKKNILIYAFFYWLVSIFFIHSLFYVSIYLFVFIASYFIS